jgi:hypothetical protein
MISSPFIYKTLPSFYPQAHRQKFSSNLKDTVHFGRAKKTPEIATLPGKEQLPRRRAIIAAGALALAGTTLYQLIPDAPFNRAGFVNAGLVGLAALGEELSLNDILNLGLLYKAPSAKQMDRIARQTAQGIGTVVEIPAERNKNFLIRTVVLPANPHAPLKDTVIFARGADNGDRSGSFTFDRDRLFAMWLQKLGYNVVIVHYALRDEQDSLISEVPNVVNGKRKRSLQKSIEVEDCLDTDLQQVVDVVRKGITVSGQMILPPSPANRIVLAGRSLGGHHAVRVALQNKDVRVGCFNMPASMPDALFNLMRNETTLLPRMLASNIDAWTGKVRAAAAKVKEMNIALPMLNLANQKTPVFIAQADHDQLVGVDEFNSARSLYEDIERNTRKRPLPWVFRTVTGRGHDDVFQVPTVSSDISPTDFSFNPYTTLGRLALDFDAFLTRYRKAA